MPEHASIARRQQAIFVGSGEIYMMNLLWKYERKRFFLSEHQNFVFLSFQLVGFERDFK